jgi:D-ribulokinase
MNPQDLYAGIDVGTSGARLYLIDAEGRLVYKARIPLPEGRRQGPIHEQTPDTWWKALKTLLLSIPAKQAPRLRALSLDGTSGTLLLADDQGRPLGPALMYNDARATEEAEHIVHHAPRESGAHGASSSLAKLLWLLDHTDTSRARHALHQADWLLGRLAGRYGFSDENNCLKLGYDPIERHWPKWLTELPRVPGLLPMVHAPGERLARIDPDLARQLKLPETLDICTGTTDSIAAFLATGASKTGEAVTSLGSTLAIKILAEQPIFAPEYGIYSHRLWDQWLVGGASNTGGAVLLQYFTPEQMQELSDHLIPEMPSGLDFYPLPAPGERFPVADPDLPPCLEPRPDSDARFFQGMLEGIARIELEAYHKLHELGAPWPTSLRSVGGGSKNKAWTAIREKLLQIPFSPPKQEQAAYGAALLARRGIMNLESLSETPA